VGLLGGFDKGQTQRDIASRFEWVLKKHGFTLQNTVIDENERKKVIRGVNLIKKQKIKG